MDTRYSEFAADEQERFRHVEVMIEHGSMDEVIGALIALPVAYVQHPLTKRLVALFKERAHAEDWYAAARKAMLAELGGRCKMSMHDRSVVFTETQCGSHELSDDLSLAESQLRLAGIELL